MLSDLVEQLVGVVAEVVVHARLVDSIFPLPQTIRKLGSSKG